MRFHLGGPPVDWQFDPGHSQMESLPTPNSWGGLYWGDGNWCFFCQPNRKACFTMVHHEEVAIWWSDWVDSWDIDIEEYPDQWTTGWWFGTFFVFPNSWDDDPIWLVFFRGVETTNSTKMCIFVSVIGHDCEPPYGTKNQDAYSNWPYMGVSENWGYPKHIGFSLQNIIKPLDDSWVPHDSRNLRDQNFWTRQNIWQCWLSMK